MRSFCKHTILRTINSLSGEGVKYTLTLVIALSSLFSTNTQGQSTYSEESSVINQQIWIDLYPHYYRTKKMEYYGDTGYRTILNEKSWSRVYVRPSLRYHFNRNWELQGGIGFFYIFNADNIDQFEVRPWQGIQLNGPRFNRFKFKNSLKLEERWSYLTDSWNAEFEFRLRYKISGSVVLNDKWGIPFYGEAFLPITGKVEELYQNQGRAGVGLSYKATKDWKLAFVMNWQRSKAGQDEAVGISDYAYQLKIIKKWKQLVKLKH